MAASLFLHQKSLPMTLAKMAFCGFAAIIALLLTPQPLDELTEDHDGEPAAG